MNTFSGGTHSFRTANIADRITKKRSEHFSGATHEISGEMNTFSGGTHRFSGEASTFSGGKLKFSSEMNTFSDGKPEFSGATNFNR